MAPQAKRRKIASAVEEINFDPTARHEYLTGFHKRKLQRIKLAQEFAEKKAREEKRQERRKIREQRAAELEQAVIESRKMLEHARSSLSSSESGSESENENENEEEWAGFEDPLPVDYEEEYIDEDKYTTVTVEEMGLSRDALHGMRENDVPSSADDDGKEKGGVKDAAGAKPGRKQSNQKKKKKKFRYESKEERKATQRKQRSGNRKKASDRRER
ncbi:hypothetical protein UA08_03880 [Talaromyces atroroseus]|uniref:Ribosomal RNA-processing protein 17 n=1 Tax=Talaromyces atroroseus TaxID=1441469 RepID=A0A225AIR1_TALAT|nr:hypothetical protein UA08_03880 [Talaromyces atroroseus]OKL61331.1 hypothetical protein UA08_03880 [Talaromyces atroroseus]